MHALRERSRLLATSEAGGAILSYLMHIQQHSETNQRRPQGEAPGVRLETLSS